MFVKLQKPELALLRRMGMSLRSRQSALLGAIILFVLSSIPGFAQGKLNHYAVYLEDQPVTARFGREALTSQAAVSYRQQIEARQAMVSRDLESRQIHVTGAVTTLMNAIFIATTEDRVAEVQSIAGVSGVRILPPAKKRFLNKATAAGGAVAAWAAVGGQSNAGAGIKIGVLDTGIDQTHPSFQDPTLTAPAGFPKCTQGHSEDCAFTNNKVIVARSYVRQIVSGNEANPTNPAADSMPDDYSPRDRTGHGTAIASAAAGNQINGPAVAFSGMAPKAFLGSYKIWGTQGVNDYPGTNVWIQALDDAVSDGMDVISMSDGGPAFTGALNQGTDCGLPAVAAGQQPNYCDPLAAAFEAAAHAGVVIAVAAGNGGSDTYYTNGNYPTFNSIISPATAPSVISVGATLNSHVMTPSVSVTAASAPSSLKNLAAANSDSFFPVGFAAGAVFPAAIAPLLDVTSTGDNGFACGTSLPAGTLNNVFVLIQRGNVAGGATCPFSTKVANAQAAGAVGVILYNNVSTAPTSPEGADQFAGPVVMISQSAGAALKTYIDANPGALVTIDTSGTETDLAAFIASANSAYSAGLTAGANQLASFSSMGPTPDGLMKPDMVAVGGSDTGLSVDPNDFYLPFPGGIYMAAQSYDPNGDLYSQNGFTSASGTSFATPLVAGSAALMKQAHAGLRGTQVKSLLVNSATQDVIADDFGDAVDAEWIGSGRLNAGSAVGLTVTAEPSAISFGVVKSVPLTQTITLTNIGSASVTLTPTVNCCTVNQTQTTVSGTTVAATPSSITIAAGGTATMTVTLSGKVPAASEYSGYIALKGGSVSMQIPFMALVSNGVPYNAYQLAGSGFEGLPGQDAGTIAFQVTDQYGIPLSGQPMSLSVSPRGSVTLKSVAGEPACSGTTTVTCNTDNFGVAYAEVILGSSLTTSALINITAAGALQVQAGVSIMAAPSLTAAGIVNDASFQQPVAPGSWVAIFGSNMVNPAELIDTVNGDLSTSYLVQGNMLPLVLDGTTVSFDVPSAGISVPGYLYYVSANGGQIDVWVPWELENQTSAQVKVTVDEGLYGNVVTLPLSNYAPSFFLNSGNVADALDGNYNIITASNPAVQGQYIALYVNGLGPTNNQPVSGAEAPGAPNLATTKTTPVVTIGGKPATVVFSGLAPGIVGEYQVNVQVPTGLTSGSQPITISIGNVTSPTNTAGSGPQTISIPVK